MEEDSAEFREEDHNECLFILFSFNSSIFKRHLSNITSHSNYFYTLQNHSIHNISFFHHQNHQKHFHTFNMIFAKDCDLIKQFFLCV